MSSRPKRPRRRQKKDHDEFMIFWRKFMAEDKGKQSKNAKAKHRKGSRNPSASRGRASPARRPLQRRPSGPVTPQRRTRAARPPADKDCETKEGKKKVPKKDGNQGKMPEKGGKSTCKEDPSTKKPTRSVQKSTQKDKKTVEAKKKGVGAESNKSGGLISGGRAPPMTLRIRQVPPPSQSAAPSSSRRGRAPTAPSTAPTSTGGGRAPPSGNATGTSMKKTTKAKKTPKK
ncbi:hypothetical protein PRIPAC_96744 [Pristionchus pacificus]|uniref:Uncharacterized protein n=1 Tax=Pristionchus pacificus TaxID=54126 RepID=A0A2A6BDU1_PRIPA|nr:hypothetical protein PRIPAC_96744 [Pristionchus pacificus]|eukprot:PDM63981.1 hypothetical protein PRIPAC_49482 [Pristionchus pacificus]